MREGKGDGLPVCREVAEGPTAMARNLCHSEAPSVKFDKLYNPICLLHVFQSVISTLMVVAPDRTGVG